MAMETMVTLMGTLARQRLDQQLFSVERGMTFLQQQHLLMLTGLHMEISHLKTRCHELSCELNSRFSDQSTADEEARRLSMRCEAAERLLWERQGAVAAVRGELRAGQGRSSTLARSLREEERHFLDELKRRSHRITSLSRDLQRQTTVAAALSQELHDTRIQLYEQRSLLSSMEGPAWKKASSMEGPAGKKASSMEGPAGKKAKGETDGGVEEEEEEGTDSRLLSLPPLASPGQQEEGRHVRSVREERVRACVPQESVTSPQRPRTMPDPALFLFPLRYRLLRWRRQVQVRDQEEEGLPEDEWEDIDEGRVPRRVDMGAGEGETAL